MDVQNGKVTFRYGYLCIVLLACVLVYVFRGINDLASFMAVLGTIFLAINVVDGAIERFLAWRSRRANS